MSILKLQTYKEIKNITSTDRDAVITRNISAVNSFISSFCNRSFTEYYDTDKTEYFDGVNTSEVFPDVYPIISVTSVKTSSDGGQSYAITLAEYTDYVVDTTSSSIVSTYDCFTSVNIPTNSMQIVYKGGYSKVPDDLLLAAAHLVEYYLEEQYTPKKALAGVSIENMTVSDSTAKLPAHVRRVLEHYRSLII